MCVCVCVCVCVYFVGGDFWDITHLEDRELCWWIALRYFLRRQFLRTEGTCNLKKIKPK